MEQSYADGIVSGSKIEVTDTIACVCRVNDGLALSAVVNGDTGLDSLHVGGVKSEGNIVKRALEGGDGPLHELFAVGLGRSDVEVEVGCAGLKLLFGSLKDGFGIHGVHCLADNRGNAMNSFANDYKFSHCNNLSL